MKNLYFAFIIVLYFTKPHYTQTLNSTLNKNDTLISTATSCLLVQHCKNGVILPAWKPIVPISLLDQIGRAIVYFFILCFFFIGVSIIADRFMTSIE
ncbi:hypothetical protein A3Q56_06123, partial [Intoshia linei]